MLLKFFKGVRIPGEFLLIQGAEYAKEGGLSESIVSCGVISSEILQGPRDVPQRYKFIKGPAYEHVRAFSALLGYGCVVGRSVESARLPGARADLDGASIV